MISGSDEGNPPTPESIEGPHGVDEWRGHAANGRGWRICRGDVNDKLATLPRDEYDCIVTSPPYYWQRDYKVAGQIGLEKEIDEYVRAIVSSMHEARKVLKKTGLLFLNLGDTYYSAKGQPKGDDTKNSARRMGLRAVDASGLGVPRKTLIGLPWRIALAMVADGWVLRSPIIWRKENCLGEPTAKDRPWRTYEHVFMFSRTQRYYFDRTKLPQGEQDVWTIAERRRSNSGLHSAAYPDVLVRRCLDVGCPEGGSVLDPFAGTGTTLRVAIESGRDACGIDLSEAYCKYAVEMLGIL